MTQLHSCFLETLAPATPRGGVFYDITPTPPYRAGYEPVVKTTTEMWVLSPSRDQWPPQAAATQLLQYYH